MYCIISSEPTPEFVEESLFKEPKLSPLKLVIMENRRH